MDKLERYLDQVCRGIAGPRSLRQHVRQELREHLNDAIADHRADGLTEEEATDRALADFGAPNAVGDELQATHGHRLMTVLIDKSLEWKERTMKAKWLWTTWSHITLGLVIALEVCFVAAILSFITPKMKKIVAESGTSLEAIMPAGKSMLSLLEAFADAAPILLIVLAILWTLFEWRARTENKTFIRLSAMGTIAMLLMALVFMAAAVTTIPMALVAPRGLQKQAPATQPVASLATVEARNQSEIASVADR